ncbi:MAG: hypothetical protein WBM40_12790 [Thiohalocapsa sp.]
MTDSINRSFGHAQYIRIVGAQEDDRTLLIYRAPGESLQAWIGRARARASGQLTLDADGKIEEKVTTVTWEGITFQIVTRRGVDEEGNPEDEQKWCARHDEAVAAWNERHR